jgi:orotate phosphoribosyltransferase
VSEVDLDGGVFEILRASGALKKGHFVLSSGRHTDQYIEKFDLFRQPNATSDVCCLIADRFRDLEIDVVAGPTTGGVILAFEVARQLGVAAAYAERSTNRETAREFRRGTTFSPGSRVLLVDDILTTGGSLRETLEALAAHPVDIAGVAVLVDRSGGEANVPVAYTALTTMDIETWDAAECPLCARGEPVVKPGTTLAAGSA